MPGPVSHPDLQRLSRHLEKGSHAPLQSASPTLATSVPGMPTLSGPASSLFLPQEGALLTCDFSQPHSPLPPATFTLKKVNSSPQGTCRSSCLETEDGATSLPLILIRKASVPRSLEATTEPDIVTNAMSTVQKPQNRTRNIFVTDKHSSI